MPPLSFIPIIPILRLLPRGQIYFFGLVSFTLAILKVMFFFMRHTEAGLPAAATISKTNHKILPLHRLLNITLNLLAFCLNFILYESIPTFSFPAFQAFTSFIAGSVGLPNTYLIERQGGGSLASTIKSMLVQCYGGVIVLLFVLYGNVAVFHISLSEADLSWEPKVIANYAWTSIVNPIVAGVLRLVLVSMGVKLGQKVFDDQVERTVVVNRMMDILLRLPILIIAFRRPSLESFSLSYALVVITSVIINIIGNWIIMKRAERSKVGKVENGTLKDLEIIREDEEGGYEMEVEATRVMKDVNKAEGDEHLEMNIKADTSLAADADKSSENETRLQPLTNDSASKPSDLNLSNSNISPKSPTGPMLLPLTQLSENLSKSASAISPPNIPFVESSIVSKFSTGLKPLKQLNTLHRQTLISPKAIHSCLMLNSFMSDQATFVACILCMLFFGTMPGKCMWAFGWREWGLRSLVVYGVGMAGSLVTIVLDEWLLEQDLEAGLELVRLFQMGLWASDYFVYAMMVGVVTVMYVVSLSGFFWKSACFAEGR
ncbi:hypothetical protein HDV05_003501 [Chytridiales sp. JEL 0842]|nr:hypothetical protein HDV05_003501 [Chytridiales sp. JEL 0842]